MIPPAIRTDDVAAPPVSRLALWLATVAMFAGPAAGAEPRSVPGLRGAIRIPFTMPCDGEATLALYTPQGRLVRPLAQVLALAKGEYVANWDGMDLWGNLLPAGAEVEVRAYTGPGVKAF